MNTETLAYYASKRSTMNTQTTQNTAANSLAIVPHGTAWKVVPPPRKESITDILERLIRTSDEIAEVIAKIQAQLENR